MSVSDIAEARKETTRVLGLKDGPEASGDPSPVTAEGVFRGVRLAVRKALGRDLDGVTVALQGVGHVGAYLADKLHAAGAKLVITDVNAEALNLVADHHYELILLDHHLPDTTGLELAQRIRARGCGTPLISLSGSHKACHPSFQGCLEKPLDPPELEKLLQRPPAVDWQVLERFRKFQKGNNQHLIRELVLTFTNSASERTQALRAAALRGSPEEVKRVAHLLRGAAASVGAVGVAEAASALEGAPEQPRLMQNLDYEVARSLQLFRQFLEESYV